MGFRVNGRSDEAEVMMANALQSVFGNVPVFSLSGGSCTPLGQSPGRGQGPFTENVSPELTRVKELRREAEKLADAKKYDDAIQKAREALPYLLGKKFEPPRDSTVMICDKYSGMKTLDRIALMGCYNVIAACLFKKDDYAEALSWLQEAYAVDKNMSLAIGPAVFDWKDCSPTLEDYFRQRVKAYVLASDVFLKLHNTGAALHRRWNAHTSISALPPPVSDRNLRHLVPDVKSLARYRHPDPKVIATMTVTTDALQVRGSWQKLSLAKPVNIAARMGFASFTWRRRFYVLGGEKSLDGPFYRDFFFLDLEHLDNWHRLPPFPHLEIDVPEVSGWSMGVYNDKAYLFNGSKCLDYFDLVTETWGQIQTRCDGGWKWETCNLRDHVMQMVDGKMYIFGGTHQDCALGCNLWMVLDIEKRTWRKLSGSAVPGIADNNVPGPRRLPVMWADVRDGVKRIWLMYGEADRQAARVCSEPHGGQYGYGYDDLWSWDVQKERWQRERIPGNPPCPRSEMGYVFNEQLGKTIVFGGYSPTLPTQFSPGDPPMGFTYYADTFMLDPASTPPRWKHVLTRGFPTYRAQAKLFVDPGSGRTFLFGGYTNTDFVPDGKHIVSKTFHDLWELKLDVAGGHYEDVDQEEEARTASLGPWKRCFNCGSAGPWKKCGGKCKGRAFFCDSDCLKEGWREHKQMHKCTR